MQYQVLQEKHTSGHLWWKRTYYTYLKYAEGVMIWVPVYREETIKALENK